MAIYEYRIRRKNDEGNYDILHVESDAALILRYDDEGAENGTVESALRNLESQVNTMSGSTMGTKADKVSGATSGNFAGLDANGNLTDSGKKAADFAAASHNHAASAINSGTLSSDRLPTVPVSKGGTGLTTLTSGSFLKGNGTSAVTLRTPAQVLSDIGAAASDHNHNSAYAPIGHNHDGVYSAIDHSHTLTDLGAAAASHNHAAGDINSGTFSVARGGTGRSSLTSGYFLRGNGTGAVTLTAAADVVAAIGAAPSGHNHDGVYAPLSSGKIPSDYLPAYVDDVIEGYLSDDKMYKESNHTTVITGEASKIYVDLSTNKTYRWSGSAFVEISSSLALGENSSTAYRGDRGKIAYDHSQTPHDYAASGHNHDTVYAAIDHTHTPADLGAAPASHNHSASNITSGTLGIARGGTGASTLAANRILYGNGTSAIQALAFPTTANSILTQGTSGAPVWKTPAQVLSLIGASASDHNHDSAYAPIGHNHDTVYSKLSHTHTYEDVGAAPSSHTHKYAGSSSAGGAANSVANSFKLQLNGGTTEGTNQFTFNGSAAKTVSITPANIGAATSGHTHTAADIGAAASSHTHNYAGSSSAGGAANSVKTNLIIKLNSGTTEGTNLFTFNGGTAKTIDITPAAIGAAASSHTHSYAASSHNHAASNITSGTLGTARGGTGITSNPSMLINLASTSAASVFATSPRPGVTGTLPLGNGGTGGTTALTARSSLGAVNVSYATSSPASSQNTGDLWFETIS